VLNVEPIIPPKIALAGSPKTHIPNVRILSSLAKLNPAMATGLHARVMKMADVVSLIDAANPVPAVRGPTSKSTADEISI